MRTTEIEIRQVRIFLAVVQSGGFSAAQDLLNLAQSTISAEIAALETRLGYRLCQRGRGGFLVTPQGQAFIKDATNLLAALSQFERDVSRHKKHGLGSVRLAMIDNIVTDPNCPLRDALDRFHARNEGRAHVAIDVLSPGESEAGVAAGRLDVAIGIFDSRLPQLSYRALYRERDILVCGRRHPLYRETSDIDLFAKVRRAEKVVRSFLKLQDFFFLSDQHDSITGRVESVEAAAILILAGHHIGFLPEHYARSWIGSGEMRVLLEKSYTRHSDIVMTYRRDVSKLNAVARSLIEELTRDTSGAPMEGLQVPG